MRHISKAKGFTFIEVAVYVAVLAIVFLAVISFFIWSIRTNKKVQAIQEVTTASRRAMEIMTQEIKEAQGLYTPTSSSTQLSLLTAKYLPGNEADTYIDFYLCDTRLCLKKETDDPIAITPGSVEITDLRFTQISSSSAPSIQINLTLSSVLDYGLSGFQSRLSATATASIRR